MYSVTLPKAQDGDWEIKSNMPAGAVCPSPMGIEARALDNGVQDHFHIDFDLGFYCVNEEQEFGNICADFEVRYCCPKWQLGECDIKGYEWTDWLDRDDPDGVGDYELLGAFDPYEACKSPIAVKAKDIGPDGSILITHIDLETGFYCLNHEQTNGKSCSDFAVSFCCPVQELTCEDVIEENLCPDNKWCLETAEGPVCKCGDDDFTDDWDTIEKG